MRFLTSFAGTFARIALAVGFLLSLAAPGARAQSWIGPSGTGDTGNWSVSTNWSSAAVPNAIGASVIFNTPPATRTVTVDSGASGFTVGSITFNNNSASVSTLAIPAGSSLILDNGGNGVTLSFNGSGASLANNAISSPSTGGPLVFNDNVTAAVNYIANSTANITTQGAFNWIGTASGTGGFIKTGPGVMTMGTALKHYTGPTVFDTDSGRTRISVAGRPADTSSVTVKSGAQIDFITAGGSYTLGTGPLNLNGTGLGPTSSPGFFPGAIRNDTGLLVTVTNPVVLQSDTLIHVQASAGTGNTSNPTGSTTLSGNVSGPGRLTFAAPNSNIDQGFLVLTGANTYSGGTLVAGGILQVSGANATLGMGNVTVDNATSPLSIARLQILAGVSNAIADSATLSLAGGNAGRVDLGAGINETVAGLVLNGSTQAFGTYGSTSSSATFQNDTFFSGTGIITVAPVPEPGGILLVCGLAAGGAGWLRRRTIGKAI
jgi:fibronectin-binding autotransporter adhesin